MSNDALAFTMSVTTQADNGASGTHSVLGTAQTLTAPSGLPHPDLTSMAPAVSTQAVTSERSLDGQTNALTPGGISSEISHPAESAEANTEAPRAAASEPEEDSNAAQTGTVHNVQVQLGTNPNERVNIHLSTQGGDLRVSVRSANADLTRTLQEHVPELTSRLEQQHYHSEVWIPRSSDSSASTERGFQSPNGDTSGQGQPGNRQNGQQKNDPEWLDEIAPQRGNKETFNSTWLQ
jgi:flagellar hook-length control protein FliK